MAKNPPPENPGAGGKRPELEQALVAHRAGRLAEAEAAYRQVLARQPGDLQARHLLGLLCAQSGRLAEATSHLEEVIGGAPALAPAQFALAELLQKQGRGQDAIAAYRAGLAAAPDNVAAMNNLAGLLRETGDLEGATACLDQALQIAPDYAPAHLALGQLQAQMEAWPVALASYATCLDHRQDWPPALFAKAGAHRHLGQIDEALACLDKLLQAVPGDVQALQAMAFLLLQQSRLAEAEGVLRQLVSRVPENIAAWSDLANLATARGDAGDLLLCHGRILDLAPEDPERWRAFAAAVRLLRVDGFDARLRDLLLAAFLCGDLDHQDLAGLAVTLLKAAPTMTAVMTPPDGHRTGPLDAPTLTALSEPLLPAVLQGVLIPDADLEAALVILRRRFLNFVIERPTPTPGSAVLDTAQALAQQCFLNEYLFDESEEEAAQLQTLKLSLLAPAGPWDDWQALGLALLASYRSLHGDRDIDNLIAHVKAVGDGGSQRLIERQFDEPRTEAALAADIPCLGDITDDVSQAVRAQYEENPYPRWHSLHRLPARPLRQILPEVCPALAEVPMPPENPRVLVAGCGTGRHALLAAQFYRPSEMVAVDLSRASLAYAVRKAANFGGPKITFYQADILDLPAHLAPFDVIESSGVLHHMAQPIEGWRALANLLKPGGLMKIALYSAAARQHIAVARDLIAARGFPATPEGIRRCRREILARGDEPAMAKLAAGRDFYSLSLCRDLIFHVQEHCFTWPEIGAASAQLGLTFLGIEPQEPRLAKSYRARFPDDPGLTSLENWAAFENDHPDSFAEMYHFWLRKPADSATK